MVLMNLKRLFSCNLQQHDLKSKLQSTKQNIIVAELQIKNLKIT